MRCTGAAGHGGVTHLPALPVIRPLLSQPPLLTCLPAGVLPADATPPATASKPAASSKPGTPSMAATASKPSTPQLQHTHSDVTAAANGSRSSKPSTPQAAKPSTPQQHPPHMEATLSSSAQRLPSQRAHKPGGTSGPKLLPVRQYMDHTVVPILREALRALNESRPDDPLQYLADYLLSARAKMANNSGVHTGGAHR